MPYLEYDQQSRPLGPGVLSLGSGTEAGWRIVGRDLLPLHALVTLERNGGALLMRAQAGGLIVVNGVEMMDDRVVLGYGDTIQLGCATFTYRQFITPTEGREGYLRDGRRGRLYRLDGDIIRIGRDPSCPVLVPEPDVSRVHAEVVREGDRTYVARPVGSAYTLLNTTRLVRPTPLKEGDELWVGHTALRFTTEPAAHARTQPVTSTARVVTADKRAARMRTVFVGSIEARERIEEGQRRRHVLMAVAAIGVTILLATLIDMIRT